MKTNKKIYRCFFCMANCGQFHEVVFGHGYRPLSIKYAIQMPLCASHHHLAHHGRNKKNMRDEMLDFLGVSYLEIKQAYDGVISRNYLENTTEKREKLIKSFEE
tara:strand:- start:3001 stop:3312 length:312 start_codon:yes stop_codon:yes gene_type:complete